MTIFGKILCLLLFASGSLMLAWTGQPLLGGWLFVIMVIGLVTLEWRQMSRRLEKILPKLYVCVKIQEYFEWLDDLEQELLFKKILRPRFKIYRTSGELYLGILESPNQKPALTDVFLSEREQQRHIYNTYYKYYMSGEKEKASQFYILHSRYFDLVQLKKQKEKHPEEILATVGQMLYGIELLQKNNLQAAKQHFEMLRSEEIFNLMFGEVNYYLFQIEKRLGHVEQGDYYKRVAENFLEGTQFEKNFK